MSQAQPEIVLQGTLIEHLGIHFVTQQPEYLEASMQVTPQLSQPFGKLHGGATLALAESLAGLGSSQLCGSSQYCYAVQVSANHLASAAIGETVIAKGRLLRQTRQLHIWQVEVYAVSTKKLLTTVNITNIITTTN